VAQALRAEGGDQGLPTTACHPKRAVPGFTVGAPSSSCVPSSAHSAVRSCCTAPALGSAARSVTAQYDAPLTFVSLRNVGAVSVTSKPDGSLYEAMS